MFCSVLRVSPRLFLPLYKTQYCWRNAKHVISYPRPSLARYMATPPPQVNTSSLSMEEYHKLSDEVLDSLLEDLEQLLEEHGLPSYEVEYSSGVLTLNLEEYGTYVINKQPPNKQIWLSSPFSGPKRYDYTESDGSWRYSRDDKTLYDLLNEEIGRALNTPIHLSLSSSKPS
ncbi:hypothetical protein D9757_006319 [Collybiopsis confluens]|uniref:ferroxidase n=1 Tax=Collybiopsis confluens TaxID=2823264 RepID=A0A8H5HGI1_9AGAR|nr:hypothetical protein D9757_006319 [Collybiopsis confluens]